ncbi:MAG: hypothetical protein HYT81_03880 [Gemmatimonadetes bacterium]|nr:hypothetical protein [Gemmatimonadota bacterium]MBI2402862.1 hypothetical protein [Gemmatimonadota bacterium]
MKPDWQTVVARLAGTRRREAVLVAAGVALGYWLLQLSIPRVLGAFHDDAVYVALAKAIAEGDGYRSVYAVGEPVHLRYPPGLPAILAPLWWIGRSVQVVAGLAGALSILATAASAGLVWWIARARLGLHPWVALTCALGPFFLDATVLYFSLPISEPYFVLGWAGALELAYGLRQRPGLAKAALLGVVVAATLLTRTQAVGVLAGLLVAMLAQRTHWRQVGTFLAAAVLPLAAWAAWHGRMVAGGPSSSQPEELSYLGWLSLDRPSQLPSFAAAALRVTWPVYWHQFALYLTDVKALGVALLAFLSALAAAGSGVLGRPHLGLTLTVAATAAVVLVWPWPQDRLVLPMLPFAGLLTAAGVHAALRRTVPRVRLAGYATLGLLGASVVARQVTLRPFAYLPVSPWVVFQMPYPGHLMVANSRLVLAVSSWLSEHARPHDRVLTDAPAAIYLYTGLHAVSARPAESFLVPSAFATPGRYLAGRIAADSVTIVVLTANHHPLAPDIAALYQRCRGVLQYVGNVLWWAGDARAFFYRIQRPDGCLRERMLGGPP